jgi:hypothetical protein
MRYDIKKGNHYAHPFRVGFWFGAKRLVRDVIFTDSCRYNLQSDDQGDTNKLFGGGKFFGVFRPKGVKWWRLWDYEHSNSARFGWRYDLETDKIELSAYYYLDKRRYIVATGKVHIGAKYRLMLNITGSGCYFMVYDSTGTLMFSHVCVFPRPGLMYLTGLYFGGNQVAPHEITISLEKP